MRISRVFHNVLHPSVTFCVKIHLVNTQGLLVACAHKERSQKFVSVTHCVMLREFSCEHRVY